MSNRHMSAKLSSSLAIILAVSCNQVRAESLSKTAFDGCLIREVDHAAAGDVVTELKNFTAKKYGTESCTGRRAN